NTKVVRPKVIETTALGAAYLAGLATGFWESLDEIKQQWQLDKSFEPTLSAEETKVRREKWADAVNRAKAWTKE
ncbi:MAG: glycerol kinase, partial [Bacteroidales bacterium]